MQTKLQLTVFSAALACCGTARSAVFCVDSESALTQALADAESNGEDNDIRLRAGVYLAPSEGWSIDLHDASRSLAITGGYLDAGCTTRTASAASTKLNGRYAARLLTIDTSESFGNATDSVLISVTGIMFANGRGANVAALKISDPGPIFGGIIRVEGNAFVDNIAEGAAQDIGEYAPAVLVATDGPDFAGGTGIYVTNNLFAANTGANASALYAFSNNHLDVTGNTFADNVSTDLTLDERVVADWFAIGGITLADNIFWNNNRANAPATLDLHFDGRSTSTHNDVEFASGTPASSTGDVSVDPAFAGAGAPSSYALTEASPVRDRGEDQPAGGISAFDLVGSPRIFGAHVDIGAFEYAPMGDPIFKSAFDVTAP